MRISITLLFVFAALLSAADSPGQFAERDLRYRLQPNDTLEIQYRYTPEYNQIASVHPDGFASLQLIGEVKLAGLTLDEAHTAIMERASVRLRAPEIFVILKDYEKPHFVVGGEVDKPGRFELRGRVTAVEAIAMAGGFKAADAKHSQVVLFRRADSETFETKILDLKRIMDAPKLEEDMVLSAGDMLLVPQNKISKIERFIKWGNFGMYWNPLSH
jgi:polysaccharide export outer membrane protein